MGFSSIFYGSGNKPYTASYQGSTYTTQTYCEPPLFKAALTMPTEFGASISGHSNALASYNSTMLTGEAIGLWIYKLFLNDQLVGVYQFSDQAFSFSATFDRIEGFCMGVPLTPDTLAVPYMGTPESEPPVLALASVPVPAPASVVVLLCAALVGLRRKR
jgi:hypothetical protein